LINDAKCKRVCIEESSGNHGGSCNFFQCWCESLCTSEEAATASAPIRHWYDDPSCLNNDPNLPSPSVMIIHNIVCSVVPTGCLLMLYQIKILWTCATK
jgi:hypothetical protein